MYITSKISTSYWLLSLLSLLCQQSRTVLAQSKALRSRQIGTEGQILARIFSEYDANTRPPVRDEADHSSIAVIVSLYINKIRWDTNSAEVELYLRQQWEDARLAYDVDVREAIDEVVLPSNRRLWQPDTYFMNADEVASEIQRNRIVVEPSGYVRSSEKRTINVNVENDDRFPFVNSRSIKLKLSSYKYQIDDVVYLWANSPPAIVPVEVSNELLEGPYAFAEASAGDCVGNYTIGVYSCIDVSISFEGSSSESFVRIFLPSILLLIVSWLHFWIHGSWSVPRTISAAVPFFVFFFTLIFYPRINWSSCGPLQIWIAFCLVLTFLSLLEYFIVICCGVRRRVAYRNGHPTHITTGDPNAPLTVTAGKETIDVEYDTPRCAGFHYNHGVDVVSRIAFPLIFLVFFIVFLIFYVI